MPTDAARRFRPRSSLKLSVFDVDGTLVDSQDLIVAAQRETFRAHGLAPPSRERSLSIIGLSLVQAFRVLSREALDDSVHSRSAQRRRSSGDQRAAERGARGDGREHYCDEARPHGASTLGCRHP